MNIKDLWKAVVVCDFQPNFIEAIMVWWVLSFEFMWVIIKIKGLL